MLGLGFRWQQGRGPKEGTKEPCFEEGRNQMIVEKEGWGAPVPGWRVRHVEGVAQEPMLCGQGRTQGPEVLFWTQGAVMLARNPEKAAGSRVQGWRGTGTRDIRVCRGKAGGWKVGFGLSLC